MTWSYLGASADRPLDAVRFLVGDVDESDPQLEDEEIDYLLVQANNDIPRAAVLACDALVAMYAREVDKAVGPLNVRFSQLLRHYRALSRTLRDRYDSYLATPVGGPDPLSASPIFTVGMHDHRAVDWQ